MPVLEIRIRESPFFHVAVQFLSFIPHTVPFLVSLNTHRQCYNVERSTPRWHFTAMYEGEIFGVGVSIVVDNVVWNILVELLEDELLEVWGAS